MRIAEQSTEELRETLAKVQSQYEHATEVAAKLTTEIVNELASREPKE